MKTCAIGANWGYFDLKQKDCLITLNDLLLMSIPYDKIALANPSSKNDVTIEFNTEDVDKSK